MNKINHQIKSRNSTPEDRILKMQQMIRAMWDESWTSAQTRQKENLSIPRKKET